MRKALTGKKIQSYWRKDTLREIYHDNDIIIKHYVVKPGTWRYPKPWAREDAALKALAGSGLPKSYGYTAIQKDRGLDVIFKRGYLEGSGIEKTTPEDAVKMADTLAGIHKHGVITGDAKIENFIKDEKGNILFFDFGAAFIFRRKTPLYYLFIGKELVKFLRLTLKWDTAIWYVFIAQYKTAHPMPVMARILVKTGFFLTLNLRRMRKRKLRP